MKTAKQLVVCILLAWIVGWFALRAIDQSDRDLRFPPKPIPQSVQMFLHGLPLLCAIIISGNAHAPSTAGALIGVILQWTITGVIFFFVFRVTASLLRKQRSKAETP
ncbi:MAG: hypothetical protein JNL39_10985 [Opitutaceae bacterium]|nr:hypothetical protein [Opitutaceae bacterium]